MKNILQVGVFVALICPLWLADGARGDEPAQGIRLVKTLKLDGRPVSVFVEKGRLYAAAQDDGQIVLHVFDLKDPLNPKSLGSATLGEGALVPTNNLKFIEGSLFVRDGLACIAHSQPSQVMIVDVSKPDKPTLAGTFATKNAATAVWLTPKRLALASSWSGILRVVDLSDPAKPRDVMDIPPPEGIFGSGKKGIERYGSHVVMDGDVAYAVWWIHGRLVTLNLADPVKHKRLAEYQTTSKNRGWGYRVLVANGRAYMSADQFKQKIGGIHVLDVSDPAQIKPIGFFSAKDYGKDARKMTRNLALSGTSLYVTDHNFGVVKLDVSKPEKITKQGELEAADARGIAAGSGAIYVAAKAGILVLEGK